MESEMLVTSDELERFHQHLLTLQQAGFDTLVTLFPGADHQSATECTPQQRLQRQLNQIEQQMEGTDRG